MGSFDGGRTLGSGVFLRGGFSDAHVEIPHHSFVFGGNLGGGERRLGWVVGSV